MRHHEQKRQCDQIKIGGAGLSVNRKANHRAGGPL